MPRPPRTHEERTLLLDARAMSRALQRMAVEILELAQGTADLVLIGIQRRGVELAERLAKLIEKDEGVSVPRGALDITLYRDDLETVGPAPVIGETRLPVDLTGRHAVIVDDVLYTGRTVRAALDDPTILSTDQIRPDLELDDLMAWPEPTALLLRIKYPRDTWPQVARRDHPVRFASTPP